MYKHYTKNKGKNCNVGLLLKILVNLFSICHGASGSVNI